MKVTRLVILGVLTLAMQGTAAQEFVPVSELTIEQKAAITKELLDKANGNIEKYRKSDAVIKVLNENGRLVTNCSVEVELHRHQFNFGSQMLNFVRRDDLYRPDLLKEQIRKIYNYSVLPFYWDYYEPEQGNTQEQRAYPFLAWLQENDITPKGHPLAWGNRKHLPEWIFKLPVEESETLLYKRIETIVREFKGQIDIWDVVNEPLHFGQWYKIANTNVNPRLGFDEKSFAEMYDWVEKCFRAAHRGNPDATLLINEFGPIAQKDFRKYYYELIKELLDRKVPIHGIGLQAHSPQTHWYDPREVLATIDTYAQLGLPVHITEFHAQSGGKKITGGWREGTWGREEQAEYVAEILTLCFGHPSVVTFNWWGTNDRLIWQPGGGMLDEDYQPKPVWDRVYDLIHHKWKTHFTETISNGRQLSFRGFLGDYKIVVRDEQGRSYTFNRTLEKSSEPAKWRLELKQ